jgi:hypothetical protein
VGDFLINVMEWHVQFNRTSKPYLSGTLSVWRTRHAVLQFWLWLAIWT